MEQIKAVRSAYKIIDRPKYAAYGIDPADVLFGTVAAENHPVFLLSRFGGNAFGLGLFEQAGRLGEEEACILSEIELSDAQIAVSEAPRLNALYKRLGLCVRYSKKGRPYYLIPLAWLAHTTAEVQDRADELEGQVRLYQQDRLKEQLAILVMAPPTDLVAEEMLLRLGGHRVVILSDLSRLRDASGFFDLVLLPQDIVGFIIDRLPENLRGRRLKKKEIFNLSLYLTGKLYDLLEADGRLILSARRIMPAASTERAVHFLNPEELKNFLIFTHFFKTEKRYHPPAEGGQLAVNLHDFYNYLTEEALSRGSLARLTKDKPPAEFSLTQIDELTHLDVAPQSHPFPDQDKFWPQLFEPFFEVRFFGPRRQERTMKLWAERFELSGEWPLTEMVFVGDKRRPAVRLRELEGAADRLGLKGCPLPLLAEYKDSFAYLFKVLSILSDIKANRFPGLLSKDLARLRKPFDTRRPRAGFLNDVKALIKEAPRLGRLEKSLNPLGLEGPKTPVLANLEKLSLLGVRKELLREILLILVGHSTMGRITVGKLPEKALARLTHALRKLDQEEAVAILRVVRLLSVAEMTALSEKPLPPGQVAQFFILSEQVIEAAAHSDLDWDQLHEIYIFAGGGEVNRAIRRMLRLFAIHEHMGDWKELITLGPHENESWADYEPTDLACLEAVQELVRTVRAFQERFAGAPSPERPYFFRRFLDFEFHGTGRLLPALGPALGFKLLWIVANVSPTTNVNFNPILAEASLKSMSDRLAHIRPLLSGLEMEDLDPEALDLLKRELKPKVPVFVRDLGLTLTLNPRLNTLDVSLVEIEPELNQLAELVRRGRGRPVSAMLEEDLGRMERLYGRLADYFDFTNRPHIRIHERPEEREILAARRLLFNEIVRQLKESLNLRLFDPKLLHAHISRLSERAPRLLSLVAPELAEMTGLPSRRPHLSGRSMLSSFLISAQKLQALTSGWVESFQDQDLFHRLALKEFGLHAAGGVGVTEEQISELTKIVARLQKRPTLLRAAAVALTFQDVARLPSLVSRHPEASALARPGSSAAAILKASGILKRHALGPKTRALAAFLVEHHDLLKRMVQGEAPVMALGPAVDGHDEALFDLFFVHNLITLSAAQEEFLTEDLMEFLFAYRRQALRVIRSRIDWRRHLFKRRRTRAALPYAVARVEEGSLNLTAHGFFELVNDIDAGLSKAERLAGQNLVIAMERLYRLKGLWFINYEAVALFKLKQPPGYIHQRLGLRGLSKANLERALFEAVRLEKEGLEALPEKARQYLLGRLSDMTRPVDLLGLSFVNEYLNPVNRLAAAVIGLKAADFMDRDEPGPVTVSFHELEEMIQDRYEFINEALSQVDLEELMSDPRAVKRLAAAERGLRLSVNPTERVVSLGFADPLMPDDFKGQAARIKDHDELAQAFYDRLRDLRARPQNTHVYEVALERIFEDRLAEIIAELAQEAAARLLDQQTLEELSAVYQELIDRPAAYNFSAMQLERINNAFELRKEQLRRRLEEEIASRVNKIDRPQELDQLWRRVRVELKNKRRLLGRQLERSIARQFDSRARQMTNRG